MPPILDDVPSEVTIVVEGGRTEYVSFVPSAPGEIDLRWYAFVPEGVTVSKCGACDGDAAVECEELSDLARVGEQEIDPTGGVILRIDAPLVGMDVALLRMTRLETP